MFACQVRIMSTREYLTIWVNTNPTCLLNEGFLDPNMTCLLNMLVMSTHLSNFMKTDFFFFFSINLIDLNYEKQNK